MEGSVGLGCVTGIEGYTPSGMSSAVKNAMLLNTL